MRENAPEASVSRRPLRLLIAEDNPPDAELMVAILKRAGYSLDYELVDAPDQFGERLRTQDYDLILSDHNLRTWTGVDALGIVRRSGKDIPFVTVTATLGDEAAVEYVKQGAADYVLKHRMERLPVAVGRALQDKAHREEAARLQEIILSAKREWELTFDSVPDVVLILDEEFHIQRANRAATQLLGLEFSQVIGRPCYEVVHGLPELMPDCPYQRMLMTGVEQRADIADPALGKVFDVTTTPLRDSRGALLGCIEVLRDITKRKRAEEALRESEARYRSLFENASLGICRSTRDGRLLDVNPAFVAMLGYDSREELLSKLLTTDIYVNPDDRESLIGQWLSTGTLSATETQWKRKDGKTITVRLSLRGILGAQNQIEGFETTLEDVTERRAMENQFYAAQKFEAIGQLAGGIAHDFNNVIGAMLGWAELGLDIAPADSPLRRHLDQIRKQAERAAGLTRQLLAFARRQALEPRNINLNQVVGEVASLLGKVIGENIELKTVLAADLRPAWADPSQMEQVLMNLCLNARDAMAQGGRLTIETRNVEFDEEFCRRHVYAQPGRFVELVISDTGVGMDAATLEHIFEPFFTTKSTGKGTGLGLATVYGIVKQSGGFIRVYSEPGHGATFYVTLPVGHGVPQREENESAEPIRGGTETILLAEDHEGMRASLAESLEKLGYQVFTARDGEEAVQIFQQHRERIDLLLCDVVMPRLSGPEAYARIQVQAPALPVLFSSGYTNESQLLKTLVQQGAKVLPKPCSTKVLARKIRELLDRSASPDGSRS